MQDFLEILKYTIPALVVFATSYYMLKLHLDDNYRGYTLNQRIESQKITLPVRLQAYERLTLLCDRLAIPNTLLRVREPEMKVGELRAALMIATAHEFDHNTSQQLYVSDTLWQIISLAKVETLSLISRAAEGLDPQADGDLLVERLFAMLEEQGQQVSPLQQALSAIRTEAGRLF